MSRLSTVAALAGKDARIVRRSPVLLGLLIVYPLLVALLLGLALSGGPAKPKVVLVNLVPTGASTVETGTGTVDARTYARQLVRDTRVTYADTRAEAERIVRDGDAVGAIVIPENTIERLRGVLSLRGSPDLPTIEVLTNDADPVRARALRELVKARLADANAEISRRLISVAGQYLGVLTTGGNLNLFGNNADILGLRQAGEIIARAAAETDPGPTRDELVRVQRFAELAARNLALASPLMQSVADPIRVDQRSVTGPAVELDTYAAAVAATVSLLLVAVLLAAGLVALEREERTFGRLVRSAVPTGALLGAKTLLAGAAGAAVALVVSAGLAAFLGLDASRGPLWILAAVAGGAACGALGVALGAIGAAGGDVRAASLLAILLLVPVVVIGLVPEGSTSGGVTAVVDGASALFPFRPGLRLTTAALEHGPVVEPLLHLVVLTAGWSLVGWWGLRRTDRAA
ncbi:ABC transporter permease [Patulibacter americanus]|uniref:ABC transporter permease n=1 Tax=Patulibacter americanus TaxID=588672 RepID=UPI0003B65205|nr:ABC transporter permease [Patulibacter americanus]